MAVTKQELLDFEDDIANLFEQGKIKAPIHLSRGNEDTLIRIFENIGKDDWVLSTHRSHYHALLKGVPKDWLRNEILAGRSITICNKDHKFFTSAIVGGIIPIGVGLAMAGERVWVFVGDMAAETGIFHECVKYAEGHDLPCHFIVEDNGLSVDTPTEQVWRYSYTRGFPHAGMGKFVIF